MPEPAVYRTESAARAHRRRQLRDAIREEARAMHAVYARTGISCADYLADRILARYDHIEADQ